MNYQIKRFNPSKEIVLEYQKNINQSISWFNRVFLKIFCQEETAKLMIRDALFGAMIQYMQDRMSEKEEVTITMLDEDELVELTTIRLSHMKKEKAKILAKKLIEEAKQSLGENGYFDLYGIITLNNEKFHFQIPIKKKILT